MKNNEIIKIIEVYDNSYKITSDLNRQLAHDPTNYFLYQLLDRASYIKY